MQVTGHGRLDGPAAERAWGLYGSAFEDLRVRAAQRHLMTRDEFFELVDDERITKLVVTRAGDVLGMAAVTHDLGAVPLVSPEYYAARYPQEYRERRIVYVAFVAVGPDHQGTGVMSMLIGGIIDQVGSSAGVVALDVCSHHDAHQLPGLILKVARLREPDMQLDRLDTQTYWAYRWGTGSAAA